MAVFVLIFTNGCQNGSNCFSTHAHLLDIIGIRYLGYIMWIKGKNRWFCCSTLGYLLRTYHKERITRTLKCLKTRVHLFET